MPNGFGRGLGFGRGMGFGFRGNSPPWPYVGLGRGGLPRCGYFLSGAAGVPVAWPYQTPYAAPGFGPGQVPYPFYSGGVPPSPQMTREQELAFLRDQAEAVKEQLEEIETRIRDLEVSEK